MEMMIGWAAKWRFAGVQRVRSHKPASAGWQNRDRRWQLATANVVRVP
jgi:hypothetical protein